MQRRNPITLVIIGALCVASIIVSIKGNKSLQEISKENTQLKTKLEMLEKKGDELKSDQEKLNNQKTEIEKEIDRLTQKTQNINN